ASFSRDVSRRGCSSTAKVVVDPSRRFTSRGKISSTKLPWSLPATARWCERSAQASISCRVTPASTAAFQPTVMDMSMLGAEGRSAWVGDHQSSQSSVPGTRRVERGDVEDAGGPAAPRPAGGGPVVGKAGHVLQARLDGGVAGDVAAAVERLGQHDVVDEGGIDPGAGHGLGDARGGALHGLSVPDGARE